MRLKKINTEVMFQCWYRQIPKSKLKMQELKMYGVYGRKPGQKGRDTYYYDEVSLEILMDLKLIMYFRKMLRDA